jgi:outer membrane protein assembly factor BamB
VVAGNGLVISAGAREVTSVDTAGNQQWHRALTAQRPALWQWGDDVVANDAERFFVLSGADGRLRGTVDAVGIERTASRRDNPDNLPVAIGRMAFSGDLAFVHLGTATVAYNRRGERQWRRPRPDAPGGGRTTAGQPLIAAGRFLVTHDAVLAADGQRRHIEINLLDPRTGEPGWPVPVRDDIELDSNANGPGDRTPPPGGQGPRGEPPRGGPDAAWNRSSVSLSGEFLVARDSRRIRLLRLGDGGLVWQKTMPTAVVSVVLLADLIVVAADRVYAYLAATGALVWQQQERGARIAVSADGTVLYVVGEQAMSAYGVAGDMLWTSETPAVIRRTGAARLLVRGGTGLILGRPADRGVDVVAVALEPGA